VRVELLLFLCGRCKDGRFVIEDVIFFVQLTFGLNDEEVIPVFSCSRVLWSPH